MLDTHPAQIYIKLLLKSNRNSFEDLAITVEYGEITSPYVDAIIHLLILADNRMLEQTCH